MKIYRGQFENVQQQKENRGVALGNFDGIHKGHRALINSLVEKCRASNLKSCVYTFENHPNNVIFKDKKTPVIMTEKEKINTLELFSVDELFLEYFDEEYANTSPEAFIEKILIKKLNAKLIVVGFDYTYGKFGMGNVESLKKAQGKYGFELIVIPPVTETDDGESVVVASTVLREFITDGRMESFSRMAGYNYKLSGVVERGRGVGKKLGFPTANIFPEKGIVLPAFGVYATKTRLNGKIYRSVTNVGNNPTFDDVKNVTIETNLIGFEEELYGQYIEVEFIKKLRGEVAFSSPEELISRIKVDVTERINMCDDVKAIYKEKGFEIYHVPTDKFKSNLLTISISTNLNKETAYKNALIPMILYAGSEKYPSINAITKRMQELYGAELGMYTCTLAEVQSNVLSCVYTEPSYAPEYPELENDILDTVFDILKNPLLQDYDGKKGFNEEIFNTERENRNEQIRSYTNDKDSLAQKRCMEIMFENEPMSVFVYGNEEDGNELSPTILYDYFKNEYLKKHTVRIFYSGKNYPKKLTELAIEFFGGQDRAELNESYVYTGDISPDNVKKVEEKQNVMQGKLFMGFRTNTPPLSEDYYAVALCDAIFGGGPQSKLFTNIREKNSLAYYAGSYGDRLKGVMFAYCGVDSINKKKVIELVLEQLEEIKKGHITKDELEMAVNILCKELLTMSDNKGHMVNFFMNQSLMGKMTDLEEYVRKIKAVTIEQISRVAQRMSLDTVYFLAGEGENENE